LEEENKEGISLMKKYKLPAISDIAETIILANGQYPSHLIPLTILKQAKYIICCDGAIDQLSKNNIEPSAIVGDCDSLSEENKLKYKDILFKNSDQETNDLTKAVQFCIKNNRNDITILGATGKRDDHTIGNISLLSEYVDHVNVSLITDYGVFTPIKETSGFESFAGQQVSLFSMEGGTITTHNLKYPVTGYTFTNWWQGTLNEALAKEFEIETISKIIVYRAF